MDNLTLLNSSRIGAAGYRDHACRGTLMRTQSPDHSPQVMIQAGDLIDNTIGVRFGLATLAAAACGQVCSDFSGVCFGGVIDAAAAKLGRRSDRCGPG